MHPARNAAGILAAVILGAYLGHLLVIAAGGVAAGY
jgi:hypothetical protein